MTTPGPRRSPERAREWAWQRGTQGRYLVLEQLGTGSIGVVHRAYDPKLRREVALKWLRTDAFTEDAQIRMFREARAMARLSHPHVVAVYDVDVSPTSGLVIAMEYVPGTTLAAWFRPNAPWRDVVRMLMQAGKGLVAAHTAGLLHRDFKPANVLVTADGQAKVGDFGLARAETGPAMSDGSTESASGNPDDLEHTAEGEVMGTPAFMSPEQHRGLRVDARTDQYAFCVSAWLGLTGRLPFRVAAVGLLAAKLDGPPVWPKAVDVPRHIVRAIRRGLQPDPDQRWPTMAALLAELGERATTPWRATAVVGVGLAGAGALALFLGDAAERTHRCTGGPEQLGPVWNPERAAGIRDAFARTGSPHGEATFERTERALAGYADEWLAEHARACRATAVERRQSEAMLDRRMACLQRARHGLQAAVDLFEAADRAVIDRALHVVSGLEPVAACGDEAALSSQVPPPSDRQVAASVQAGRVLLARARRSIEAGRADEAAALSAAAQALPRALEHVPLRAEARRIDGAIAQHRGDYQLAERAYAEAYRLGLEVRAYPDATRAAASLAFVVGNHLARPAAGAAMADLGLALAHARRVPADAIADLLHNRAAVAYAAGRFDDAANGYREAIALRQQVFGPSHLSVVSSLEQLAIVLTEQGDSIRAEQEQLRVLELRRHLQGPEHPDFATSLHNLGLIHLDLRMVERSEQEFRAALALRLRLLGERHPIVASTRSNLAITLLRQQRLDEAEEQHRIALDIRRATVGEHHRDVAVSHNNIGRVLMARNRYEQAIEHFTRTREILETSLGREHPDVAAPLFNIADAYVALGRLGDAEPHYRRALAIRRAAYGPDSVMAAESSFGLAQVVWQHRRGDEALPLAEHAYAILSANEVRPAVLGSVAWLVGKIHAHRKDRGQAALYGRRSSAAFETALRNGEEVQAYYDDVLRWCAAERLDCKPDDAP